MHIDLIQKAYAADLPPETKLLLGRILYNIVNPLITLALGVAIVVFLWGVFQFVRKASDPKEREKGGMHILFGVLGIFIMIGAYGILNLILGTIGK